MVRRFDGFTISAEKSWKKAYGVSFEHLAPLKDTACRNRRSAGHDGDRRECEANLEEGREWNCCWEVQ